MKLRSWTSSARKGCPASGLIVNDDTSINPEGIRVTLEPFTSDVVGESQVTSSGTRFVAYTFAPLVSQISTARSRSSLTTLSR